MRGIDFIQIPTSLLAQADSSIGGKTGVDIAMYKNIAGAFYMPRLVYANVSVLASLDQRQFSSGFAEVMKHGLIRDEAYYVWLLENMYEILDRDPETPQSMLYRSNEIKKEIVERDPLEKGDRMLLNMGHTIGHAIEKYSGLGLAHGECVALGCVAAAYISWKRDMISKDEYYEIRDMFVPFGLPITADALEEETVLKLTRSDKKVRNGVLRFVLLRGIGQAVIDETVSDEEILAAIHEIHYVEDGE
jgi:3-dehydroquinate synthase